MLLVCFSQAELSNMIFCLPPMKSYKRRVLWCLCVCNEEGLCLHDRERKNRAGWKKKHRKPGREENQICGEIRFSNDISIVFNLFQTECVKSNETGDDSPVLQTMGRRKRQLHLTLLEGQRLKWIKQGFS